MKNFSFISTRIILVFSGLFLLLAILSGVIIPPHNLLRTQMIPALIIMTAGVFLLIFLIPSFSGKRENSGEKLFRILFLILITVFGIAIFVLNFKYRLIKASLQDYAVISANAECIAKGTALEVPDYYLIASNNFKPTLILALCYKLAYLLGFSNPYVPTLLIFTAWTVVSVLITCLMIEGKNAWFYRFLLLLGFLFMLPLYIQAGSFYTDSMTFGTAIITLFLMKKSVTAIKKDSKPVKPILLSVCAGFILAVGYGIKVTVLIPIIAGFMVFLFWMFTKEKANRKVFKTALQSLAPAILAFILFSIVFESYSLTFKEYRDAKKTEEPIVGYIALGLKGNGSFVENSDFGYAERYLANKEEKAEFSKQYIKENAHYFFEPDHILRKMNYNFSSGFLGASDFCSYPEEDGNLFYHLFDAWGNYYWRTSQYCYLYIHLLYAILLLGAVYGVYVTTKEKKIPCNLLLGNLTFLGLFIFLMIWEANNRQLYNQMPVLLFGAVSVIRSVRSHK